MSGEFTPEDADRAANTDDSAAASGESRAADAVAAETAAVAGEAQKAGEATAEKARAEAAFEEAVTKASEAYTTMMGEMPVLRRRTSKKHKKHYWMRVSKYKTCSTIPAPMLPRMPQIRHRTIMLLP